jgi:UDP-3-O-[3-hydroxymyristoyl] glucosamine N-acyltransferase
VVTRSLTAPGMYSSVFPVEEVHLWRRQVGRFRRLDVLADKVDKLKAAGPLAAKDKDHDS